MASRSRGQEAGCHGNASDANEVAWGRGRLAACHGNIRVCESGRGYCGRNIKGGSLYFVMGSPAATPRKWAHLGPASPEGADVKHRFLLYQLQPYIFRGGLL